MMDEEEGDMRCGFCMEKLQTAIQPKQLPCSHVYCLSCLIADYKKTCPTCKQIWAGTSAESLRAYLTIIDSSVVSDGSVPCDCCKSDMKENANTYCVNCEKTLCEKHELGHDDLFDLEHDKISIKTYLSSQSTYKKKKKCTEHSSEVVTIACGVCHRMFCRNCDMNADCEGDWRRHGGKPSTKNVKPLPADAKNTIGADGISPIIFDSVLENKRIIRFMKRSMTPASETLLDSFGSNTATSKSNGDPTTSLFGIEKTTTTASPNFLLGSTATNPEFGRFKATAAAASFGFGTTAVTSSSKPEFGAPAATSSSKPEFGATTTSTVFGGFVTTAATTSSKSGFGVTAATMSLKSGLEASAATTSFKSGFGATTTNTGFGGFGTTAATTSSGFGATAATTGFGFGTTAATSSSKSGFGAPAATSSSKPEFGATTTSTVFGGFVTTAATTSSKSGFGVTAATSLKSGLESTAANTSFKSGFGATTTNTGLGGFGTTAATTSSGFGATAATTSFGFGTTAATSSSKSGFGAPAATPSSKSGFGATTASTGFGGFRSTADTTSSGFGATAATASSGFGVETSAATPSSKSGFGAKTISTGFGGFGTTAATTSSGFGATAATSSSGFGAIATTPCSKSGFGATTTSTGFVEIGTTAATTSSRFGATAATASSKSGFRATPTTSIGFDKIAASPATPSSKPLFGTTNNIIRFGAAASSKSSFGSSSGGLFGCPINDPSKGSTGNFQICKSGTVKMKFAAVDGTDNMVRNGICTQVKTKHHCITGMKQYEKFSMEELRLADYLYNGKTPTSPFEQKCPFGGFGFVPKCDSKPASTPPPVRKLHEFMPITELINKVEDDIQGKLTVVSDRRTNILKAEKRAWRLVDGVETHSERLKNLVDKLIKQQCDSLHQLGCKAKQEIDEDAEKAGTEAATYSNKMDAQNRQLLKMESQLSSQLGRQYDSSGLLDFLHRNNSALNKVPSTPVDEFTFEKKTVQFLGGAPILVLKSYLPTNLDFVSIQLSAAPVVSLSFLPNGDITIAKAKSLLEIRNQNMDLVCSQNVEGQLMGVTAFQNGVAALVKVGDQACVNHYTNGLNDCSLIAEWASSDLEMGDLTGCGNQLVVSQSSSKTVKQIVIEEETIIHEKELNEVPDSLRMVYENCLEVSCSKEIWRIALNKTLTKKDLLRLKWGHLLEMNPGSTNWMVPRLNFRRDSQVTVSEVDKKAKGILSKTTDSSSLFYGCREKTIWAFNNDHKYSCMTHPELTKTEEITAIAVSGGQLVAGCGSEGLKIFNIV